MKTITLQEAQQCLPELIHLVEQGEEVLITQEHLTIKLVVLPKDVKKRRFGQHTGQAQMSDDFNQPLPESFWLNGQ